MSTTIVTLLILGLLINNIIWMEFYIQITKPKKADTPKKEDSIANLEDMSNTIAQMQDTTVEELEKKFPVRMTAQEKEIFDAIQAYNKDGEVSNKDAQVINSGLLHETFEHP